MTASVRGPASSTPSRAISASGESTGRRCTWFAMRAPQTTGCDHTSTSTRVPGKVTIRIVSGSGQPPATWIARRLADTTAASGVRKSSISRPTRPASVEAPRSFTHALDAATIWPSTWTRRGSAVVSSSCR